MEQKQGPGYPHLPPQDPYPHPPPPSYTVHPPPPPQPHPQAVIMNVAPVGPTPSNMTCPSCHATVQTKVVHEASTRTHIIAGLLCLFGCWCCVCVPYCMESCQNANHYCPNCNAFLGSYQS